MGNSREDGLVPERQETVGIPGAWKTPADFTAL